MITTLVSDLRGFSPNDKKGFTGWFRNIEKNFKDLWNKYDTINNNIKKIDDKLLSHQMTMAKDLKTYEKLNAEIANRCVQARKYIAAGKRFIEQETNTTLKALIEKAKQTKLPEDARAAKEYRDRLKRLYDKVYDLLTTRTLGEQSLQQLDIQKYNNETLSDKIDSIRKFTIPAWRDQMTIAIGIENTKVAVEAAKKVTDFTNDLIKKNSEKLKKTSIAVAKESRRAVVDIDTLIKVNDDLIETMIAIVEIDKETTAKKQEGEIKMEELRNKLNEQILAYSTPDDNN